MKRYFLLLMLFIGVFSFSQIKFEKGYFVTNSGERVECFIKNADWRNNPKSFEYRIDETGETQTNDIKNVQLFEIYNQAKYIRSTVKIDKSGKVLSNLSNSRDPEFVEEQVFLKEIIAGDVSLYRYTEDITRFFYRIGNGEFEPLIYKLYKIYDGKIGYNEEYKTQLEKVLVCASIDKKIQKLQYKEKDLTDLFIEYYQCSNSEYEKKSPTQKGKFNLYIQPRINSSSLEFSNIIAEEFFEMENKTGFSLGIEIEYVLPFNKNKWAIMFAPAYQSYKSEKTTDVDYLVGGKLITNVDYKSIELPIGIRHYMYISDKSKLFIDAQYVWDVAMKLSVEFKRADGSVYQSLESQTRRNIAFGLGYNYNNKYGVAVKYYTNRNILGDYLFWQSKYKNIALVLSYNVF
ncbi:MAG: tRNA modification GTPase [Flavobacteriaceae bacterium]|jgi:hypothetical protein|nr:tRNA modification GTPase [Flavobacteriaceae bacterium]